MEAKLKGLDGSGSQGSNSREGFLKIVLPIIRVNASSLQHLMLKDFILKDYGETSTSNDDPISFLRPQSPFDRQ